MCVQNQTAGAGDIEGRMVRLLIDGKADVNRKVGDLGQCPLHLASSSDLPTPVQMLLEAKVGWDCIIALVSGTATCHCHRT